MSHLRFWSLSLGYGKLLKGSTCRRWKEMGGKRRFLKLALYRRKVRSSIMEEREEDVSA